PSSLMIGAHHLRTGKKIWVFVIWIAFFYFIRKKRVVDKNIIWFVNIAIGTKAFIVILIFGRGVYSTAFDTVTRQFLSIIGYNILPELWTIAFEHISNMSNNRKVMAYRVVFIEENVANGY